jgi:hypothetical protein
MKSEARCPSAKGQGHGVRGETTRAPRCSYLVYGGFAGRAHRSQRACVARAPADSSPALELGFGAEAETAPNPPLLLKVASNRARAKNSAVTPSTPPTARCRLYAPMVL